MSKAEKCAVIGISEKHFGASEALALFIFKNAKDSMKYELRRVGSDEDLANSNSEYDVLIGVGDYFDPKRLRFSHSGRRYNLRSLKLFPYMNGYTGPLSTSGLVYAIYGNTFLKKLNPDCNESRNELKYNFRRIFEFFIEVVDCHTFEIAMEYPTIEKESLLKYLEEYSADLALKLKNLMKDDNTSEFLSVVNIYSRKIGDKFLEILHWYYYEYMKLMLELTKSLRDAPKIHASGRIAFCDFDFGRVTLHEILVRVKKTIKQKFPERPQAAVLVIKSIDCYRVECLVDENFENPAIHFPEDWPVHGDQIERVLGISGVRFISGRGTYAVVESKETGIALAISLIKYWQIVTRLKSNQKHPFHFALWIFTQTFRFFYSLMKRVFNQILIRLYNSCSCSDEEVYLPSPSEASTTQSSMTQSSANLTTMLPTCSQSISSSHQIHQETGQRNEAFQIVTLNEVKLKVEEKLEVSPVSSNASKDADNLNSPPSSSFSIVDCSNSHNDTNEIVEFAFDVIGDESIPQRVTVKMVLPSISLNALNAALHAEYPELSIEFGLCHKKDNTPVLSSLVTESPRFWLQNYADICYASLSLYSATDSSDVEYDVFTTPLEETDPVKLGVNVRSALQSTSGAEILACAIIASYVHNTQRSYSIIDLAEVDNKVVVEIGIPNVLCYSDESAHFTNKNVASLLSMDLLCCDERLACAGIAFAIYGIKSITKILELNYGENFCAKELFVCVFRRLYARLILPIDRLAIAASVSNTGDKADLSKLTPEAKLFVAMFGMESDGNAIEAELTSEEASVNFALSLPFARHFYERLVVDLFRQMFPEIAK